LVTGAGAAALEEFAADPLPPELTTMREMAGCGAVGIPLKLMLTTRSKGAWVGVAVGCG
jgi:hypothetical protein